MVSSLIIVVIAKANTTDCLII